MTIRINEEKIFELIDKRKPKILAFSAPGGLIKQTRDLIKKIEATRDVKCILLGDTCYGICDYSKSDALKIGADIVFNVGHSAAVESVDDYIYFIEAYDDIGFENVIKNAIEKLHKHKKLGLVTFSQHLHKLNTVKEEFESAGFEVLLGRENKLLKASQIFGCDFSSIYDLKDKVEAFIFLGESEFHAVGIAMATGKPTYMLDPYLNEVFDMEDSAKERTKRAILAVYKALDATNFGIITGLKEGQFMKQRSNWITRKLELHGKKVFQLAMREITPERLAPYTDIEAFVQTACPRISLDGYNFDRPVLSIPQADALIRLLEGRDIEGFLIRPKWIELTVGLV
jgi:2-(3-amino-3-carboxypropyl)histidine synthase